MIESFLSFGNSLNLKGYIPVGSIKTINSLVYAILTLSRFNRLVFILPTSSCLKCLLCFLLLLLYWFRCCIENLLYWLLKDVVQLSTSGDVVWIKRICWKLATLSSLLGDVSCVQGISTVVLFRLEVSNFRPCSFDVTVIHNIPYWFLITFWSWCAFNVFTI